MTDTGIWNEDEAKHHVESDDLAMKLQLILDPGLCTLDFGCGRGDYIRMLLDENYECCIGIEGSSLPEHRGMDIRHLDLSNPIYLLLKGQVLSLEVGEHIPAEYESVFLENLVSHCDSILILSWGLPGQAGIGHVNCQPQEDIIRKIEHKGMHYCANDTEWIRDAAYTNAPWFRDTLMVFRW